MDAFQIDRAIAAGAEDPIEVALRAGLWRLAVEDCRQGFFAVRGPEMPGRDALQRLRLGPEILRAEIEHGGAGTNMRSASE